MAAATMTELWDWRGVALAIALGLLIGVQRGWAAREGVSGSRFAGIRTFGLLGLAGGLAGALYSRSAAISVILIASCAALLVIGYVRTSRDGGPVSATTSVVGLVTVTCGFLAAFGQPIPASVIAVAVVLLLALRSQLHRFVGALSEQEVIAIGRFALIALVIMPLLPDAWYGPYSAWNPRQLWLVVVLVSGLSLAGYLGARMLGASRGVMLTAIAGSMVSSTAVTAAMAAKLRAGEGSPPLLTAAVAIASATMCLRLMVLIAFLARFALVPFAILVAPPLLVSAAAALWFLHAARHAQRGDEAAAITVRNPFALTPALLLMALVMVITVIARWMLATYGDSGVAVVLAISGAFDTDSTVIALGNLPVGTLSANLAGVIMIVPVVLNSLVKAGVALAGAGLRQGWPAAAILITAALSALAMVPLLLD